MVEVGFPLLVYLRRDTFFMISAIRVVTLLAASKKSDFDQTEDSSFTRDRLVADKQIRSQLRQIINGVNFSQLNKH